MASEIQVATTGGGSDFDVVEWDPLTADQIDSNAVLERYKNLFSYSDSMTGHSDNCNCKQHYNSYMGAEKGEIPFPLCNHGADLQQFSTPFGISCEIAMEIKSLVPKYSKFLDLGAGNGSLSAGLLLFDFRGVAIETDRKARMGNLKAVELELPMGGKIGYEPYFCCICSMPKMDADFVISNPPFKTEDFLRFVGVAMEQCKVLFMLIPTNKYDNYFCKTPFQKFAEKKGFTSFPIKEIDFPLRRTREWHTHEEKVVETQLVCVLRESPESRKVFSVVGKIGVLIEASAIGRQGEHEKCIEFDFTLERIKQRRICSILPNTCDLSHLASLPFGARQCQERSASNAKFPHAIWPSSSCNKIVLSGVQTLKNCTNLCVHLAADCPRCSQHQREELCGEVTLYKSVFSSVRPDGTFDKTMLMAITAGPLIHLNFQGPSLASTFVRFFEIEKNNGLTSQFWRKMGFKHTQVCLSGRVYALLDEEERHTRRSGFTRGVFHNIARGDKCKTLVRRSVMGDIIHEKTPMGGVSNWFDF